MSEKEIKKYERNIKRLERYLINLEQFEQTRVTDDMKNTDEIWISSETYPLYLFCTTGEIFSARGNKLLTPYSTGKTKKDNNGTNIPKRLAVGIYDLDGIYRRKNLSSLLVEVFALYFDIANWNDIAEIHHKDLNPLNNRLDNLQPLSSEAHKYIHKLIRELNKAKKELNKAKKKKDNFNDKHRQEAEV